MRQRGRRLAFPALLAGLALSGLAAAETAPPSLPPPLPAATRQQVETLLANGRPGEALQDLLAVERRHSADPDYDYLLGLAALQSGAPLLAMHAFERVVFVQPQHAGAWVDLALAHLQLGELDTAAALLDHVEDEFRPLPPTLAALLPPLRQRIEDSRRAQAGRGLATAWHGEFAAQRGHTSNANAGLSITALTLTPAGSSPVLARIDPGRRPHPDHFSQARTQAWRSVEHGNGAWSDLSATLRVRQYRSEDEFDTVEAGGAYTWNLPLAALPQTWLALGASGVHLRLGGDVLANVSSTNAGLRRNFGACQAGIKLDDERRHYLRDGYFPARIAWLGGDLQCRAGEDHLIALQARSGRDRPQGERPGGDTRRDEIGLAWQARLPWRLSLDAQWLHTRNRDAEGYSPLLDHNQRRQTARNTRRLGLNWGLGNGWFLQAGIEDSREDANIALFRIGERQATLGLRYLY